MDYLHPAIKWTKMFHITIFCAVFSGALVVNPHLIPANWLQANFFNGNVIFNFWATVSIPFVSAFIQLIYKQVRFKKKLTNEGKKSLEFLVDEYHIPAFYIIDMVAVVCLIIGLLIASYPDAAKPEYYKDHVFVSFFDIMVVPFISIIVYWAKADREQSMPNFIINHIV
jgi:hypothetical protein